MTNADRGRFASLLAALAASFGKEADEATAEGYWIGLCDLEIGEVELACQRAIRECKFFPVPVELRRLAGQISAPLRAVTAWGVVSAAVGSVGYMTSVDFDDPIINATVRNMGGWPRLCSLGSEDFSVWARKEFERVYSALCEAGTSPKNCGYLAGHAETENAAKGYTVEPPRRIVTGLPPHRGQVAERIAEGSRLRLLTDLTAEMS